MYRSVYLLICIKDCTTLGDLYLSWDYHFIVVPNILDLLIDGYAAEKIRFSCSSLKGDIQTWRLNSAMLYFNIEHVCSCSWSDMTALQVMPSLRECLTCAAQAGCLQERQWPEPLLPQTATLLVLLPQFHFQSKALCPTGTSHFPFSLE